MKSASGKCFDDIGDFNLSIRWEENLSAVGLLHVDTVFFNCFNAPELTWWMVNTTYYPYGNFLALISTS